MKREYNVYAQVGGGKFIGTFEAKSKEDAIKQASESNESHISLCHQCARECEDAEITEFIAEEA